MKEYPHPGQLLRMVLRRLKISHVTLADATGIGATQLGPLFSGRQRMSVPYAVYLSQALPPLTPDYWMAADALHHMWRRWPLVEKRMIVPLVKELFPRARVPERKCICAHEEREHVNGGECGSCICPMYLPVASYEAYNQLMAEIGAEPTQAEENQAEKNHARQEPERARP